MIYSDEDKIDDAGRRFDPYFKPDFDHDLLLAQNFVSHLGAYRRDLLLRLGGMREGFEGSQDHDLVLRAAAAIAPAQIRHIPHVLYHWRQGSTTATFSEAALEDCIRASERAVAEHLAVTGVTATVVRAPLAPIYLHVHRPLPQPTPLVSIIIPVRDRSDLLRACLTGLLNRTNYDNMEIIVVDNGSESPETLQYFLEVSADPRVRILPCPGPFNFSRLNNRAAEVAHGSIFVLLNNDIEVIKSDWLRELVCLAVRPGIGAVGAKLLYANDTIQHAGVVIGAGLPDRVAGHIYIGASRRDPGAFGALAVVRSSSAVTAACLAVSRAAYCAVSGLDEDLAVAFNDIDFCLRLRKAGYRNLWTPAVELIHLESASRGSDQDGDKAARFAQEVTTMRLRWKRDLDEDPYWNPNLSLADLHRRLAFPPRVRKRWLSTPPPLQGSSPESESTSDGINI